MWEEDRGQEGAELAPEHHDDDHEGNDEYTTLRRMKTRHQQVKDQKHAREGTRMLGNKRIAKSSGKTGESRPEQNPPQRCGSSEKGPSGGLFLSFFFFTPLVTQRDTPGDSYALHDGKVVPR